MKNMLNKIINLISILYITIPLILFSIGWLDNIFMFVTIFSIITGIYLLYKNLSNKDIVQYKINNKLIIFWIISVILLFLWVYLSGIGGFGYQNKDFRIRNPIYHDLCNMDYPVIYKFAEKESLLSYYFMYWLTPSFISKIFNLSLQGSEIILFVYSFIGVLLAFRLLTKFRKQKYHNLILFILFSGIDVLGVLIRGKLPSLYSDLEWILGGTINCQYTSMTSSLFWIFNQAIPLWIIMGLFCLLDDAPSLTLLSVLSFIYSPWTIFGIVPLVIYKLSLKNGFTGAIKSCINPYLFISIWIFTIFGLFYTMGDKSSLSITSTFIYFLNLTDKNNIFLYFILYLGIYLIFISGEFFLYHLIMKKSLRLTKYKGNIETTLYPFVFIELLIFPLFFIRDENFIMRASLPAVYLFMTKIMEHFDIDGIMKGKTRKYSIILIILLCLGAITPIHEISRSVISKINHVEMVFNPIESFNDIMDEDKKYANDINERYKDSPIDRSLPDYNMVIEEARGLYLSYDYKDKLFYKIMRKENVQ